MLREYSYFKILCKLFWEEKLEAYLVGGALRDFFLDKKILDYDIVVKERVAEMARYFAEIIQGKFIIVNEEHKIYRVIARDIIFDFTSIKGDNIREDLSRRDFTINALALPICSSDSHSGLPDLQDVIDPFGGLNDLRDKIIRATNERVFREDPLRLWRAFRFSAEPGFKIEEKTSELLSKYSLLAGEAARERIKEELMKILQKSESAKIIRDMEEVGLLSSIIPEINEMKQTGENKYHREDVWAHSLQVLAVLEEIVDDGRYKKYIAQDQLPLLKLTALLHDIGKIKSRTVKDGQIHYFGHEKEGVGILEPILKGLRLSRKEISFVCEVGRLHMRPFHLYTAENLSEKGILRFFRQGAALVPVILIHSLADKLANMRNNNRNDEVSSYVTFVDGLLTKYGNYQERTESLYLNGKEIMTITGLPEGPLIGKLLNELHFAQGNGEVNSREEAIAYIINRSD
ncbi:MAG: HD domain-containing protein [Halanaerobiaceae bacterium]|nr:HD domain-containing protein [Halanaerobiaceae bacterium]